MSVNTVFTFYCGHRVIDITYVDRYMTVEEAGSYARAYIQENGLNATHYVATREETIVNTWRDEK